MQRVLFICYGNICRSTMAESVFTELVRRAGREGEFVIDSAATSAEEIGNPPHHGTVAKLREVGIPVVAHRARQVRRAEYGDWDRIVYMDAENARGLRRIFGDDPDGKITRLLDWTGTPATSMPPTATCSPAAPLCSSSCRFADARTSRAASSAYRSSVDFLPL